MYENFVSGYIDAALWSSNDDSDVPLDENYGRGDIDAKTVRSMELDCAEFYAANEFTWANVNDQEAIDDRRAGFLFWLNRNGHGSGYWDEDGLSEKNQKRLSEAATKWGAFDLYVGDDGQIHGSPLRANRRKRTSRNGAERAELREWRVRDRLTRARYYFDSRAEADAFVADTATSEITGEPLSRWMDRLVVERNNDRLPAPRSTLSRRNGKVFPRDASGALTLPDGWLLKRYNSTGALILHPGPRAKDQNTQLVSFGKYGVTYDRPESVPKSVKVKLTVLAVAGERPTNDPMAGNRRRTSRRPKRTSRRRR